MSPQGGLQSACNQGFDKWSITCNRAILITKKLRHENSLCFTLRVLITPKTCDVSSDKKICEVYGRTAHAQFTRSTIPSADADMQCSTYSCTETPIRPLAHLSRAIKRKSGLCGSHVSKITIFLLCAFSLQNTLQSFARSKKNRTVTCDFSCEVSGGIWYSC